MYHDADRLLHFGSGLLASLSGSKRFSGELAAAIQRLSPAVKRLQEASEVALETLERVVYTAFVPAGIGGAVAAVGKTIVPALRSAQDLRRLTDSAIDSGALSAETASRPLDLCSRVIDTLTGWQRACADFTATDDPDRPPIARWIERDSRDTAHLPVLSASPVSASDTLRRTVWPRFEHVVLTSATLTALGDFGSYLRDTGLSKATRTVRLASPFDLKSQAALTVEDLPSPKLVAVHTDAVVRWLGSSLDPTEASLVLFCSRARMRSVVERLPAALRAKCLVQGSGSRTELLTAHSNTVRAGEGSVLCGLASFAEGTDLPADLCTHVVIVRVPFDRPDDPVGATYSAWLERHGRSAFAELVLPKASLRLTQWCGRLIRSESNKGEITILDSRLLHTSYGRRLLAALPPFRRGNGLHNRTSEYRDGRNQQVRTA